MSEFINHRDSYFFFNEMEFYFLVDIEVIQLYYTFTCNSPMKFEIHLVQAKPRVVYRCMSTRCKKRKSITSMNVLRLAKIKLKDILFMLFYFY